jgi:hypothetical protein
VVFEQLDDQRRTMEDRALARGESHTLVENPVRTLAQSTAPERKRWCGALPIIRWVNAIAFAGKLISYLRLATSG